jgi:D-alanyl-lipoteichoic acid acyltransferase DltB (MBOAT superfamily)
VSITSLAFLACCTVAVLVYWRLPASYRIPWLFILSIGFLASWAWELAIILVIAASVNFLLGQWLGKADEKGRLLLWMGIGFNLLVLAGLKYSSFYAAGLTRLLERMGIHTGAGGLRLLVPVGLSFITLQMISYLVDVHHRTIPPEGRWLDFALYTVYFPKALSGPIERAKVLLPAIKRPKPLDVQTIERCFWLVIVGLARKVIFADTLARMTPDEVFFGNPQFYAGQHLAVYLLAYAFMIYNDFAGYTSIVRGLSGLFGIELSINFNLPYFSRNFAEFWERWHVSLSHWLRDYVYFPLSRALLKRLPDRNHAVHWIVPPLTTMLVSGLWHGLSWHFLVWGALHGLYLIGERVLALRGPRRLPDELPKWRQAASSLMVFLLAVLAWIPFSMGLAPAWIFISRLFSPAAWIQPQFWALPASLTGSSAIANWWKLGVPDPRVFLVLIPAIALDWAQSRGKDETFMVKWPAWKKGLLLAGLGLVFMLLSLAETGAPFIYQGY